MSAPTEPIGVVLAGGLGRRIGGSKATVELCGRPLIWYPLKALQRALQDVAVIAKPDTELPGLPGVTVWIEPQTPRHPLVGIVQALALAANRPVLICAGDLPFLTAKLIGQLARCDPGGATAVIAAWGGEIQPLLGCYQPRSLELLRDAATRAAMPVREAVEGIGPRVFEVDDPEVLFEVNAPDDLLQAAAMLSRF